MISYLDQVAWNMQGLLENRLDGEPICYRVEQIGGTAYNTDRSYCLYQRLENDAWTTDKVLLEPEQLNNTCTKIGTRKAAPRILEHAKQRLS